jgi:hypothetical protein
MRQTGPTSQEERSTLRIALDAVAPDLPSPAIYAFDLHHAGGVVRTAIVIFHEAL